jgi:hypothetical protein
MVIYRSRIYLHDLILELGKEVVNDLVLFDGERVQVDLFHALDLAALHEAAQLGDGHPFLVAVLGTAASATSASTTTAPVATTIASRTKASTGTASVTSVSHVVTRIEFVGGCKKWPSREKGGGLGFVEL